MRPEKENLTLHGAADAWLLDREAPLRGLGVQTLSGYRTFVNQLKAIVPPEVPAAGGVAQVLQAIVSAGALF